MNLYKTIETIEYCDICKEHVDLLLKYERFQPLGASYGQYISVGPICRDADDCPHAETIECKRYLADTAFRNAPKG